MSWHRYTGSKRFVQPVLRGATKAPRAVAAILWNTARREIRVDPSIPPSVNAERAAQFAAECERAGRAATQVWQSGGTLEGACEVVSRYVRVQVLEEALHARRERSGRRSQAEKDRLAKRDAELVKCARELYAQDPRWHGLAGRVYRKRRLRCPKEDQIRRILKKKKADITF